MPEILYRKWRPRTFAEVAGQEHVATTLRNALNTNRVAHAYLFAGPRGTGKTSTGRLLGKALNCTNRQDGEPCNQCESCLDYLAGRALDLIELDAASNRGIDEIRSLRDKVAFAPGAGAYKVYLIDEVHMLTDAAFNALLKTLEEPPPHVVFILATTEAHKLPATIISRSQRFDFRRIPLAAAVGRLKTIADGEGITAEPAALDLIARTATGSLRDGTNLLDQLATSYGNDLTVEHVRAGLGLIGDERAGRLARLALQGDLAGGLTLIASVRDDGLDLRQFQREIIDELRDLLMVKSGLDPAEGATIERLADLREAVDGVSTPTLLTALRSFGEADLKQDPNSTLPLDIALAECALADAQPVPARQNADFAPPNNQTINRTPNGNRTPTPDRGAQAIPAPPAANSPSPKSDSPSSTSDSPSPKSERGPGGEVPPPYTWPAASSEPEVSDPPPSGFNPQSVPTTDGSPLESARAQMRPIFEKARAAGFQLGALLNSGCDVLEADDGSVTVGFRHGIHAAKASEQANAAGLSRVFSEILGRPITFHAREAPDVADWKQRETAARSSLVRAAQEMGARIIATGDAPNSEDPR
jgi:DNA polymerase-3 subunit gamma/tau